MSQVNLTSCPICSSSEIAFHSAVKDHSISKEDFHLSKCSTCGFLFTNPQPNDSDLWKYYESEDYVSHSKSTKGFINFWYKQVQSVNLNLKFNAVKKNVPRGTWLDYGAGAGDFVKFCVHQGVDITGFEPSETARSTAKENGVPLEKTELLRNIEPSSIACITMWHVLEHIPNFKEVLTSLTSKLQPRGALVIAVPNHLSKDAAFYGADWAALDVPRHLWHFNESNISQLAEQLDLRLVDVRGMVFDSVYVSLLSEKYRHGSKLKGILNGLSSNVSAARKNTPYSSQIYILKKTR